MKIVVMAEGDTEQALGRHLKQFLDQRAAIEGQPRLRLVTKPTITTKTSTLQRLLRHEFQSGADRVVGLIDVYPDFRNATEAKAALTTAANDSRFIAHAAQFDVEAWLLPYWDDICHRIRVSQKRPAAHPESVNSQNPPAYRLKALYRKAEPSRKYDKVIEMYQIMQGKDLTVSANDCPEFKAFLNTLLILGNLTPLP